MKNSVQRVRLSFVCLLIAVFLLLTGCGTGTPSAPEASAAQSATVESSASDASSPELVPGVDIPKREPRTEIVESLRADLAAVRHLSDGGGSARLEDPGTAIAGRSGRWTIVYEVGPEGIADGGVIFLQISPFWGWSTPQTSAPDRAGYTLVSTDAEGVALTSNTLDQQLLGIVVGGRGLRSGEQVRIVYGAGSAGAVADRFAERDAHFWISVDGDGDGIRQVLADSPSVDVFPGSAARLLAILPSTAHPEEDVCLTLSVLDAQGSGGKGVGFAGEIKLQGTLDGEPLNDVLPPVVRIDGDDPKRCAVSFQVSKAGIVRVSAESADGRFRAQSNALQIAAQGGRILWADLQVHSGLSDGTGRPADVLRYAREIAALDVVALTDHDHWGMLFIDQNPAMWEEIRTATDAAHEPGRFVTLLGYEWTNWISGHRHVLYFDEDQGGRVQGEIYSSIDPDYDTPQELWTALREGGHDAVTIAHHSAGDPISIDWTIPPDPQFEPVTEIVSVHGSSEALDSESVLQRPLPGNFVRDALERGYRFGFLGSTDGHDGHPGMAHLVSPSGGLAAVLSDDLSRTGVRDALRERRVYATNGARILLRTAFGGYRMGADVPVRQVETEAGEIGVAGGDGPVPGVPPNTLVVQAHGADVISRIDIIRSGQVIERVDCQEELRCSFGIEFAGVQTGEYLYVRVIQTDGGMALSSPFYFSGS